MRRLVLDAEDLLALNAGCSRADQCERLCRAIENYHGMGFEIVVLVPATLRDTAVGPDTSAHCVLHELPEILRKLVAVSSEFDFGKPATGPNGLVLDDKAVTLEEFLAHDHTGLHKLVNG